MAIQPLTGRYTLNYDNKTFTLANSADVMAANKIFKSTEIDQWYTKFNRFGYIDPYNKEDVLKEFLFFTKPDLRIYSGSGGTLTDDLEDIPYFKDCMYRYPAALWQLQQTSCPSGLRTPFINILTNSVTSKLDLPDISAESQESTPNIMGTTITLRGHSYKSDNGYDFTLSFSDTAYLEIYHMVKAYDEFIRRTKTGETSPYDKYIKYNIASDQFSVYKFLIGQDGETIMYWAKATGVYFTNVPRSDFGDPTDFGKYTLSFHAQFVEDNNPRDLVEFNRLVKTYLRTSYSLQSTYNYTIGGVDNSWVRYPIITRATDARAMRRAPANSPNYYDYRLRWIK